MNVVRIILKRIEALHTALSDVVLVGFDGADIAFGGGRIPTNAQVRYAPACEPGAPPRASASPAARRSSRPVGEWRWLLRHGYSSDSHQDEEVLARGRIRGSKQIPSCPRKAGHLSPSSSRDEGSSGPQHRGWRHRHHPDNASKVPSSPPHRPDQELSGPRPSHWNIVSREHLL